MEHNVTIYLAGKVQGAKHGIAKRNQRKNVEYECSDGGDHSEHLWGFGNFSLDCSDVMRQEIQHRAIEQLRAADMLFAYLDTPDSYGSIAEIAYFVALGKPALVTIRNDHKPIGKVGSMFDAYWFVCAFPRVTVREVADADAASAVLSDFLDAIDLGLMIIDARQVQQIVTSVCRT